MNNEFQNQQLSLKGITGGVVDAVDIFSSIKAPGLVTPAPTKHSDGWDGNAFYFSGKKYVVAISSEISKNGLHELRTYCYTGDNTNVPEEKPARIVTAPTKRLAASKSISVKTAMLKPTDKKCLFCGKPVTWGNKKTQYCSDGCRTAAYRQRNEG